MRYDIAELDRRMAALLQAGTVDAVDYDKARCRVRVGEWVSAWLPWASLGAGKVRHWRPPSVGEQALVLSPSGDPAGGFVIPGFYVAAHREANDRRENITAQDYPDGAREHYDHAAHERVLDVPAGGKILLRCGASSIEISNDGVKISAPRIDLN